VGPGYCGFSLCSFNYVVYCYFRMWHADCRGGVYFRVGNGLGLWLETGNSAL
jgi:hypothetical protein